MGILLKKTENGISSMFFGALLAVTFLPACAKTGDPKKSGSNSSPEFVCKALSSSQEALLRMARGTEKDEQTTLVVAVDPERVRAAAKSESPNFRNENCETPLTVATRTGNQEIVKALLESGADVNLPGVQGSTALHFAAERTDFEMMKILIQAKADPNRADVRLQTPLHRIGLQCGLNCAWEPSIRLLREAGANSNSKDEHGRTPLHLSSRRRLIEPSRLLISIHGDPKAEDDEKRTPLHHAVLGLNDTETADSKQLILLLASKGALPDARDSSKRTPLEVLVTFWTNSRENGSESSRKMAEILIWNYGNAFRIVQDRCGDDLAIRNSAERSAEALARGLSVLADQEARPVWSAGCGILLRNPESQ